MCLQPQTISISKNFQFNFQKGGIDMRQHAQACTHNHIIWSKTFRWLIKEIVTKITIAIIMFISPSPTLNADFFVLFEIFSAADQETTNQSRYICQGVSTFRIVGWSLDIPPVAERCSNSFIYDFLSLNCYNVEEKCKFTHYASHVTNAFGYNIIRNMS